MFIGRSYAQLLIVPDVHRHFSDAIKCASSCCKDAFGVRARVISTFFAALTQSSKLLQPTPAQNFVVAMARAKFSFDELESLPLGISLPLQDALHSCRARPPDGWPVEAYRLVGRIDLALLASLGHSGYEKSCKIWSDYKSIAFWRRTYSTLLFANVNIEPQTADAGSYLPHDKDDGSCNRVPYVYTRRLNIQIATVCNTSRTKPCCDLATTLVYTRSAACYVHQGLFSFAWSVLPRWQIMTLSNANNQGSYFRVHVRALQFLDGACSLLGRFHLCERWQNHCQ